MFTSSTRKSKLLLKCKFIRARILVCAGCTAFYLYRSIDVCWLSLVLIKTTMSCALRNRVQQSHSALPKSSPSSRCKTHTNTLGKWARVGRIWSVNASTGVQLHTAQCIALAAQAQIHRSLGVCVLVGKQCGMFMYVRYAWNALEWDKDRASDREWEWERARVLPCASCWDRIL